METKVKYYRTIRRCSHSKDSLLNVRKFNLQSNYFHFLSRELQSSPAYSQVQRKTASRLTDGLRKIKGSGLFGQEQTSTSAQNISPINYQSNDSFMHKV